MHLSLVIPAFNESAKIQHDLEAARKFLKEQPFSSEILVVNDGSTDATQQIAEAYAKKRADSKVAIRVLAYGQNRGKGYAVRYGVEKALGERIAFVDSGLCVPLEHLLRGLEKIDKGYDFAIGSRRIAGTRIVRPQPLYRRLGSKAFWIVVQSVMGVRVSDTQCGFKVYSGNAAKEIFSRVRTDGFMFDIEALIVARKQGLRGAEFPVEWSNDGDSRYHPIWGTIRNFRELMKIRYQSLRSV
jgi:glycosyltransferase involved in cell wall biosynthesis